MASIVQLIDRASAQYGVPPALETALLQQESGLNPSARNVNAGGSAPGSVDRGIAQINSYWQPQVSAAQAYDPTFAIPWSARQLASLKQQYGSWSAALQAYNSGSPTGAPGYAAAVLGRVGSLFGGAQQTGAAQGAAGGSGSGSSTAGSGTLLGWLPGTFDQAGLVVALVLLVVGLIWIL